MKVLITGGKGFIGRYVIRELSQRGHEPVSFDRYGDGFKGYTTEIILGDIRDATAVTEAVAHVQGVIHLAGVLGTQETITNPRPAAETNILGVLNVLEACSQYSVPLVNIGVGNWFEANTYSVTKHCGERLTEMYRKYRQLPACTVRCFNVYGPRQSVAAPHGESRVRKIIPSFISRALHGEPIQVYGDGSQVMDMIYAPDAARVLVTALEQLERHGPVGVPEAGTGVPTTVTEIAKVVQEAVGEETGKRAEVEFLPLRPGESPSAVVLADTTTLSLLGIDAREFTPLSEGIVETARYYAGLFRQ